MKKEKKLLFSLTKKDFRFDYFCGSGKGGQNRNRNKTAVRCTHVASRAVGTAQDHKSQDINKKNAFKRMANTKEMRQWLKVEASRRAGEPIGITVDITPMALREEDLLIEIRHNGMWVEAPRKEIRRSPSETSLNKKSRQKGKKEIKKQVEESL